MKNLMIKTWKPLLSLLFGVAVVIFWAVPFVGGLCFQEQYQMFLFDTGYFLERIVLPGGLADYISEFLVQFYYMPVLSQTILAWMLLYRIGLNLLPILRVVAMASYRKLIIMPRNGPLLLPKKMMVAM